MYFLPLITGLLKNKLTPNLKSAKVQSSKYWINKLKVLHSAI